MGCQYQFKPFQYRPLQVQGKHFLYRILDRDFPQFLRLAYNLRTNIQQSFHILRSVHIRETC